MDAGTIGTFAANVMEQLADEFDESSYVRTLTLVVEVDSPDAGSTEVRVACTDDRAWVQAAFLNEARILVEERMSMETEE